MLKRAPYLGFNHDGRAKACALLLCRPIHATLVVTAPKQQQPLAPPDTALASAYEAPEQLHAADGFYHQNGVVKPQLKEAPSAHNRGALDETLVGYLQTDPDWCRQVGACSLW